MARQASFDVDEPELHRQRKVPRRYEVGDAPAEFPNDSKTMYHQWYFEALDLVVGAIQARFDQRDFQTYCAIEDLLLNAALGNDYESNFPAVMDVYGNDLDGDQLRLHLGILSATFGSDAESTNQLTFRDVKKHLLSLSQAERALVSQVMILVELILVLPCTNAVSERSFSALRRLKTYLRTTMLQARLNHLLLLHVHKERTDSLSCIDVANAFVTGSEHRLSLFGHFGDADLRRWTMMSF